MEKGEENLKQLIAHMQPVLQDGEYVFCHLHEPVDQLPALHWVGLFREREGLTLILPRQEASLIGFDQESVFAMITLNIHSSLEAVGFLAAITSRLAARGISTNAISAYFHDHLFVPAARAGEALECLTAMTGEMAGD